MITRQFSPQITICVLLFFSVFIQAESPAQSSFRLTPQWESKYVSEGMNWLEDGGIFSFDGAMEWSGLMAGALLSTGDIESYRKWISTLATALNLVSWKLTSGIPVLST